jgi:hypothetical protein
MYYLYFYYYMHGSNVVKVPVNVQAKRIEVRVYDRSLSQGNAEACCMGKSKVITVIIRNVDTTGTRNTTAGD